MKHNFDSNKTILYRKLECFGKIFHFWNLWFQNAPIYLGPQQFGCPFCQKIMKSSSDMKRHIMIHTGEKPFSCEYCEYSSCIKSHVKSHMANKHKDCVGIWFLRNRSFLSWIQVFQVNLLNYRIDLIPFIWVLNILVVLTAQWLWKHPKILEDIFWYILELSHFPVNTANILPIEKIIWNPTWLTCIKTVDIWSAIGIDF